MANKDSMIFYQEWRKAVEELPAEQRCKIYEAIFDYAFAGIQPQDAIVGAVTAMWRKKVDKDQEIYEAICERNRRNGQKGGRPKKPKETHENPVGYLDLGINPKKPKETHENPIMINDDVIGDNNDVANATIITPANAGASALADEAGPAHKEEKVNLDGLLKFYNDEMDKANSVIPRARNFSRQRLTMLKARIREYGKEAVADVIRRAARSNFLNGGGAKGFVADFTWILRPENFLKILEGKFDNEPPQVLTTTTTQRYGTAPINLPSDGRAARHQEFARHIATRLTSPDDEPDITGNY